MSVEALTWALNHSRAKGNARLVLIVIANAVNPETGVAWPGVRHIARQAGGPCERTVQNAIADLCALGELRVTPRLIDGQQMSNLYEMVALTPVPGRRGADFAPGAESAGGADFAPGAEIAGGADSAPVQQLVHPPGPRRCTPPVHAAAPR